MKTKHLGNGQDGWVGGSEGWSRDGDGILRNALTTCPVPVSDSLRGHRLAEQGRGKCPRMEDLSR